MAGRRADSPVPRRKGGVRLMSKTDAIFYAADGTAELRAPLYLDRWPENVCRELGDVERHDATSLSCIRSGPGRARGHRLRHPLTSRSDEAKLVTGSELVMRRVTAR